MMFRVLKAHKKKCFIHHKTCDFIQTIHIKNYHEKEIHTTILLRVSNRRACVFSVKF